MMTVVVIMMNYLCDTHGRGKAFSRISCWNHYQSLSPSQTSDTPRAGFESGQTREFSFLEWSCAVVITTATRHHVMPGSMILILLSNLFPFKINFFKQMIVLSSNGGNKNLEKSWIWHVCSFKTVSCELNESQLRQFSVNCSQRV